MNGSSRWQSISEVAFWIAELGVLASAAVHVSTFWGVNPERDVPFYWVLQVLAVGILALAIVAFRRTAGDATPEDLRQRLLRRSPRPLLILTAILFAYAMVNFVLFVRLSEGGGPAEIGGRKVLANHGTVLRTLTDEEYEQQLVYQARGFSGHWLVLYAAGMTVLYGVKEGDGVKESDGVQ